jgi:hypothetical protein
LRSNAAHPATNASVSSKNTPINAKNKISTTSPGTGLMPELRQNNKLGLRVEKHGSICDRRCKGGVKSGLAWTIHEHQLSRAGGWLRQAFPGPP